MDNEEVTLAEAARITEYSQSYLRTFCQSGLLPARQIKLGKKSSIWLVKRSDLDAWEEKHKEELKQKTVNGN